MLKLLIKKQLREIFRSYFVSPKTKKMRSKNGIIGFCLLFVGIILCCAFAFYGMSMALVNSMHALKLDWLFFALMGLISFGVGIIGSAFNTYAVLYKAKDNDLMLSLPIKPTDIVISKVVSVVLLSILYSSIGFLPAVLCYIINIGFFAKMFLSEMFLTLCIGFSVSAFSSLLGWLIALISSRLKNKNIFTVIFSLAFMGTYYYFNARTNYYLTMISQNAQNIASKIKAYVYPAYILGKGSTGSIQELLIFALISFGIFALVCFIMAKTYINVITTQTGSAKRKSKDKTIKAKTPFETLIFKESKRFLSSANYLLNCGMGIVMMIAAAIAAIIKGNAITNLLSGQLSSFNYYLPVFASAVVCLMAGMIDISSPSVSLEGKSYWILRSMPINTWDILKAKFSVQIIYASIPTLFLTIVLAIVLGFSPLTTILMCVMTLSYVVVSSISGVFFNLLFPNLTWTNEIQPIKQSSAVFISIFGGMVFSGVLAAIYYFLGSFISPQIFLLIASALFVGTAVILIRYLKTKGCNTYENL